MLSLSTSFLGGRIDDGEALVAALEAFGVPGVELEYRIREKTYHSMLPALRASGLRVTSVHNFFPHPAPFDRLAPGGDLFSLADRDRERRRIAVQWTARTLERAEDLEAPVVVLHCGRVEMDPALTELYAFVRAGAADSEAARALLAAEIERRDRRKPPHLDALCFSLDRLLNRAAGRGLVLGLENRYHFHELPGPDDFAFLFAEFRGAPLGYWHDTGHAHAAGLLGLLPAGELPPGCAERLVGIHLHDARGLDDHLPPGDGEIDFAPLKEHIRDDRPLVMELRPGTATAEVRAGLDRLRGLFQEGDPSIGSSPAVSPEKKRCAQCDDLIDLPNGK